MNATEHRNDAGEDRAVHQQGGVQKGAEFMDGQGPKSSGKALGGVQKVAGNMDELAEFRGAGEELARQALGLAPAPVDARAQAVGAGAAAPPAIRKMGRPVTVTPAVAEQLCLLMSIGFSRRQAAAYLGFSPSAITNAVARCPELGEELQRAEALCDLQPELTLMAEARKNWRAAAWYLQFKVKHPRPLSEEEKEERQQDRLADERRNAEATLEWKRRLYQTPEDAQSGDQPPSKGFPAVRPQRVRKPRRK
jgi:hypothetical protein